MGIPSNTHAPTGANALGSTDLANGGFVGTFTAAATTSPYYAFQGAFNVVFGGPSGPNGTWSGSIQLERSFDGGATWYICGVGGGGQQAIYSTSNQDVSFVASEPEQGVLYRLHCTALTAGTVNYRMTTTSPAPTAWGIPTA
jgi:hypothetical protein